MDRLRGIIGADTNGEAHAMCDPGIGSAAGQLRSLLPPGECCVSDASRDFGTGDLVMP